MDLLHTTTVIAVTVSMNKVQCCRVKLSNDKDTLSFIYDFATYSEAEHFIELVAKYTIEHNLNGIKPSLYPFIQSYVKFKADPKQQNLRNILIIDDIWKLSGKQ